MFREMRRIRQNLPLEVCREILEQGTSGILAVAGDGGYPYAVPLSYVFREGNLYFHCAQSGHKLDALRREPKASFCVVGQDQVVPEEYTTYFRSVIVFGTVRELTDPAERRAALQALADKYCPEGREAAIGGENRPLCLLELSIEHMTGKEGRELARQRAAEAEMKA